MRTRTGQGVRENVQDREYGQGRRAEGVGSDGQGGFCSGHLLPGLVCLRVNVCVCLVSECECMCECLVSACECMCVSCVCVRMYLCVYLKTCALCSGHFLAGFVSLSLSLYVSVYLFICIHIEGRVDSVLGIF